MSSTTSAPQVWRPQVVRRARDAEVVERRLERAEVLALRGYEEHLAAQRARRERESEIRAARKQQKLLGPLYLAIKALLRCILKTAAKAEREEKREASRRRRAAKRKARRRVEGGPVAKPAPAMKVRTLGGKTVVVEKPPAGKPKRGRRRHWRRPRAATVAGRLAPEAMCELSLAVAEHRCEVRRPGRRRPRELTQSLAPKLLAALQGTGEGKKSIEAAASAAYGKPLAGGILEWDCHRRDVVQEAGAANAAELRELGDEGQISQVQAFEHGLGAVVRPTHASMAAARLFAGNGAGDGKAPSTQNLGWAWKPQPAQSSWGRSRTKQARTLTLDAKLLPRPNGRGCLLF